MYRILIVEDSPEAERTLHSHIDRYAAEKGVDLHVTWQQSAFEVAGGDARFDLIFLDIELPGIDGMEAAGLMREFDPDTPIIFVTNLAQYAVKGYEVDALDFVVKPVTYQDFRMKMDKALRAIDRRGTRSISIPLDGGFKVVPVGDVVYVDVTNHDLAYHLADASTLVARGTLSGLAADLASASFVRVSNSCLVNMAHIAQVKGTDIHLSNGDVVWFSRSRKKPAMETIARYLGGSI